MTFILEAVQVSKEIAGRLILQDISLSCSNNTKLLIRGKNGSGKSTLLKMLAGITEPTSGQIVRSAQKIGYVPEHFPESLRFTLKEYLLLVSSFQGGSKASIENEISKYIELFGLEAFLDTSLKACSKGTKQKVGIIQALLMKPDLLLLDEPLTGLDAESQQVLIELLNEAQTPIIFTSHEEALIRNVAKEIFQIETGEITVQSMKAVPKKRIRVAFHRREDVKDLPVSQQEFDGNVAVFTVEGNASDEVLRNLLQKNCSILEVRELT
ncbi:ATP-binding cassette domain-containing protein [Sporosarcina sp. ACRSL]|uniref:ATP-binding cassette domain-containing protein n=1 Tax=Sporosarcina sp. ACRSL TaxID=2918215 RepID=UPI001EF6C4A1|nr:ATP-binding cassette domain-containing protein [Sporosarcina sp. ACRSL]MCG7343228.1 ATP-binding cassette domain-containing protein [Sporosarcina sp. ACRSL]